MRLAFYCLFLAFFLFYGLFAPFFDKEKYQTDNSARDYHDINDIAEEPYGKRTEKLTDIDQAVREFARYLVKEPGIYGIGTAHLTHVHIYGTVRYKTVVAVLLRAKRSEIRLHLAESRSDRESFTHVFSRCKHLKKRRLLCNENVYTALDVNVRLGHVLYRFAVRINHAERVNRACKSIEIFYGDILIPIGTNR